MCAQVIWAFGLSRLLKCIVRLQRWSCYAKKDSVCVCLRARARA
jgi:hypothetical protein